MYEHEIKFEVKKLDNLLKILDEQKVEFYKEKHQIDKVWILKDADGTKLESGKPVVRTREENDKVMLTLKIELEHGTFEEHETEIENLAAAEGMLGALGLRKLVTIDKHRKMTKLNEFTLCIDSVKDLGDFLEIEFVSETKDDDAKQKIITLASTFGINESDIVKNTYNTLLCRKFDLK